MGNGTIGHLDFAIIFTASGRSPKMRNLADDPRISIGVLAPLVGQASSRGAQLFGDAVVVNPHRIVYTDHWLRREGYAPRQFWKPEEPVS